MSNKVLSRVSPWALTLALVAGVLSGSQQGCGSGGGSSNFQAVCDQGCDKQAMCMTGYDAAMCKQNICTAQCSNASARTTKSQQCIAMSDCTAFLACVLTIPACQTTASGAGGSSAGAGGSIGTGTGGSIGTGTGGSIGTGTGGSVGTGTGGTSGSACAPCAKFDACCMAAGQSNCTTNASCVALTADQQATVGATCQTELNLIAGQPGAPAACK
jgi:hypothetical protein